MKLGVLKSLKNLGAAVKGAGSSAKFKLHKNAPTILMVAGGAGTAVAMGLAIKKTMDIGDILTEHENEIRRIKQIEADYASQGKEVKLAKETTAVYTNTVFSVARLYALPLTIEGISLFCIFMSHKMMSKRVATIGAAYATLDAGFREYRKRVAEKFGEEAEKKIRLGAKEIEVEKESVDDDGNKIVTKETIEVVDKNSCDYEKLFTRANKYWDDSEDIVQFFFLQTQRQLNEKLKARSRGGRVGSLTLNEAYQMHGFEPTVPGMVVGWIYDRKQPYGDNYIELTVTKVKVVNENGELEDAYKVDYNVDGDIYKELYRRDLALRDRAS